MIAAAFITARGGSKRIPKKNIKPFCGKPIIQYSIEAAINSGVFDIVMVSTEDEEIASISKSCGAEVPFLRSKAAANDYATTADVLLEVLGSYQSLGIDIGNFCCIYPTAPFVTSDKLRVSMKLLKESDADSVIPIVQFSFPPQRGFVINDGKVEIQYPDFYQCRSQDLQPTYHDCGQFYCVNALSFYKHKSLIMPNTLPLVLPETEVQDIDNEDDWKIAEAKYRIMRCLV